MEIKNLDDELYLSISSKTPPFLDPAALLLGAIFSSTYPGKY